MGDKLTVRRKFSTYPGRKDRWWFTIRSDEDTLLKFEEEWSTVELHTKWKLEYCMVAPSLDNQTATNSITNPLPDLPQTTSNSVPNQSHPSVATPVSTNAQNKERVSVSPVLDQGDQGVPIDLPAISPSSFHNVQSPIPVT